MSFLPSTSYCASQVKIEEVIQLPRMATTGCEECMESCTRKVPAFSNLEIRGSWTGDSKYPVDIKIVLDVKCTPNSQLQLLDTRSSNVYLISTSSICKESSKQEKSDPATEFQPPSPLFASAQLRSPKHDADTSPRAEGRDVEPSSTQLTNCTGPRCEKQSSSLGSVVDLSDSQDAESSLHSFSPPSSSSGFYVNVAKREVCEPWRSPRKRSAAVACLSDSEGDSDKAKRDNKHTTLNEVTCKTDSGETTPKAAITGSTKPAGNCTGHHRTSSRPPSSPDKASQIPIRITSSSPTEQVQKALLTQRDAALLNAKSMSQPDRDRTSPFQAITPGSVAAEEKRSLGGTLTSAFEGIPDIVEMAVLNKENTEPGTMNNSQKENSASQQSLLDIDVGLLSSLGILQVNMPRPLSPIKIARPLKKSIAIRESEINEDNVLHSELKSFRKDDYEHPYSPSEEPELMLVDGILSVRSSELVKPATYGITVTASCGLEKSTLKGWYDLKVPGLPKLRAFETGFFLFQTPENRGVEFRTTNLQRYSFVEDCFIAQFSDSGNLVIPMRVCDRRCYVLVKDFTVDQEIEADYGLTTTAEDILEGSETSLLVRYNAICSLKVHNRCFWAEKCCFSLYLDGGPEGFFRFHLDSQADPQIIHLKIEDETTTGITHIQVTCPPSDLEFFCIRWDVKLPFQGSKAMNWLPRVYPTSSSSRERDREFIRNRFTAAEARLFDTETNIEVSEAPQDQSDIDEDYSDCARYVHLDDSLSPGAAFSLCVQFAFLALAQYLLEFPFPNVEVLFEAARSHIAWITDDLHDRIVYRKRLVLVILWVMCMISSAVIVSMPIDLSSFSIFQRETDMWSSIFPKRSEDWASPEVVSMLQNMDTGFYGALNGASLALEKSNHIEEHPSMEWSRSGPETLNDCSEVDSDNGLASEVSMDDIWNSKEQIDKEESPNKIHSKSSEKGFGSIPSVKPVAWSLRDRIDYALGWRPPAIR